MINPKIAFIAESVKKFLRRSAHSHLLNLVKKVHPSELAATFEVLKPQNRQALMAFLLKRAIDVVAEMLIELDEPLVVELAGQLGNDQLAPILKLMNTDDAVSILEYLPEERREDVLARIQDTPQVEEQLLYPDETAGRIMTTDYFSLSQELTVKQAIEQLQELEDKAEMVFYLYLVDEQAGLSGVLSLRQLLLSKPSDPLKEIMTRNPIQVTVDTDQEEVASIVSQYDLLAIPVVDMEGQLAGIITVDDVIDVIREEAEEDIYRLAGTTEEELLYRGNPWKIARIRLPWLLPAFLGTFLVAALLSRIETTFIYFAAYVVFMPMINATAGNIGIQSTTIMARELALQRVDETQWRSIFFSQIKVGFLIGLLFGMVAFGFSYFLNGDTKLAWFILPATVGIAMFMAVAISAVYGSLLPIVLKKLGFDPAVSTGPFIAASNDLIGLVTYFSIAFYGTSLLN